MQRDSRILSILILRLEEPRSDLSQLARPDGFTAQYTESCGEALLPFTNTDLMWRAPNTKQKTASDAFGRGSAEVVSAIGIPSALYLFRWNVQST